MTLLVSSGQQALKVVTFLGTVTNSLTEGNWREEWLIWLLVWATFLMVGGMRQLVTSTVKKGGETLVVSWLPSVPLVDQEGNPW